MEVWVKYVSNATICESVIFHNWKGRRLQDGQWGVALASEGLHPARATGWFKSPVLSLKLSLKHYCTITQTILELYCIITQTILYFHSGWFESVVLSRAICSCIPSCHWLLSCPDHRCFFLTTILGKS